MSQSGPGPAGQPRSTFQRAEPIETDSRTAAVERRALASRDEPGLRGGGGRGGGELGIPVESRERTLAWSDAPRMTRMECRAAPELRSAAKGHSSPAER